MPLLNARMSWRAMFLRLAVLNLVAPIAVSASFAQAQATSPQLPLKPAGVTVPAVVQRTLPALTHPELLQPNPQPHIFVRTLPNRAFRPGEQISLVVIAFDAKTGAQLQGLPVAIGNVTGVTSRPIPFTVSVLSTQHCGVISGQQYCLNVLAGPSGTVAAPADKYPGGGGNFKLSVLLPRLLVRVAGGPILPTGTTTFTVSALDAHTHQPAAGAQVLMNGSPISSANQTIAYAPTPLAPLRTTNRLGVQTLAQAVGPIMVVRAPGYSDEIVHYVIASR